MSNNIYKVYGIYIESEIELLNIPKIQGNPSARIVLVDSPSELIPAGMLATYYSPDRCALSTQFGTIDVFNGDTINVFLNEDASEHDIAPFIIGWGFGFLFNQRHYTVFHCSALNINGHGVIVSGVSGAGKSSTALALIASGAKYLADDMAIINPNESMDIVPAYPIQKVCRDVSIGLNKEDLLHINEGRDKFSYRNETDYCDSPVKASHFILLNIHDGEDVIVKEHTGLSKWMKVLECMYLNELFSSFGLPEEDKKNCLKIAEAVKVFEISRPRSKDTIDEITQKINDLVNLKE